MIGNLNITGYLLILVRGSNVKRKYFPVPFYLGDIMVLILMDMLLITKITITVITGSKTLS